LLRTIKNQNTKNCETFPLDVYPFFLVRISWQDQRQLITSGQRRMENRPPEITSIAKTELLTVFFLDGALHAALPGELGEEN
jgi:hypothetical protein